MKPNIIKEKSFLFAIDIIELYKLLVRDKKEYVMSKQLLRSGTSIGANIGEAEHAESKADFVHKMSIALKEANETEYWLDLIGETKYISVSEFQFYQSKILEILRILISIVNSCKQR